MTPAPILVAPISHSRCGPVSYASVIVAADLVEDLESARIRNENRLRTLTATDDYGKHFPTDSPEAKMLAEATLNLKRMEDDAVLALGRAVRQTPFADWQKDQRGLGEKTLGRLLKEIGDPAWNYLHDRPRTVSELWAYCGLHVVGGRAARRQRGTQANWSTQAKTRTYLIAESMMKNGTRKLPDAPDGDYDPNFRKAISPWGAMYLDQRAKQALAVHGYECKQCKAAAGDPLTAGHQHARALRYVGKQFLKELWKVSRSVHTSFGVQTSND